MSEELRAQWRFIYFALGCVVALQVMCSVAISLALYLALSR